MDTSLAIQPTHFVNGYPGTQNLDETKATRAAGDGTEPAIDQSPPSDAPPNPADLADELEKILPKWSEAPTAADLAALLAALPPMAVVRWAGQLRRYADALAGVSAKYEGKMPPHLQHLDRAMQALQPVLARLCTQRSVPKYLHAGLKTVRDFLKAGLPLHEELTKVVIAAAVKGRYPPKRLEAVLETFTLLLEQRDGLGPPLSDVMREALPNLLEQVKLQRPTFHKAIEKELTDSLEKAEALLLKKKASVAGATAETQDRIIKKTAKGARLAHEQAGLFADDAHARELRKEVARRFVGEFGAAALEHAQLTGDPRQTLMHVAAALHFVKALLDEPQSADLEGILVDKVLPNLLELTLKYRFDEVGSHAIAQALTAVAQLAALAKPTLKEPLMEAAKSLLTQAFLLDGSDAPDRKLFHTAVSRLVALEIVTVTELRSLGTAFAKRIDESSAHRWLSSPVRPCTHQMLLLAKLLEHDLVDDKKIAKKAATFLAVRLEGAVAVLKDAPQPRDPRADSDTLALVQAAQVLAWRLEQRQLGPAIVELLRTWADQLSRIVPPASPASNDRQRGQHQGNGQGNSQQNQGSGKHGQDSGKQDQDQGGGKDEGSGDKTDTAEETADKKLDISGLYRKARLLP